MIVISILVTTCDIYRRVVELSLSQNNVTAPSLTTLVLYFIIILLQVNMHRYNLILTSLTRLNRKNHTEIRSLSCTL